MNWHVVEGNWKQIKGKVRMGWGKLMANRLQVVAGERIELAGRMQKAYGIAEGQVELRLKRFARLNKQH